MCFDQKTSAFFTLCGVAMTVYAYRRYKNFYMAVGIGWFTLMEFRKSSFAPECVCIGDMCALRENEKKKKFVLLHRKICFCCVFKGGFLSME